MGTIPTIATATAGTVATAAYMNSIKAANDFWALTPRAYAYQSSSQTLSTSGTEYAVNFDAELFDIVQSGDSPMHDTATTNSRVYIRTTGKYRITSQITFSTNSTGFRQARVRMNAAGNPVGGTELGLSLQDAVAGNPSSVPVLVPIYQFTAGDYVEVFAVQTSGGSLGLNVSSPGRTYLAVELVGA